jgi:hypothetical protein
MDSFPFSYLVTEFSIMNQNWSNEIDIYEKRKNLDWTSQPEPSLLTCRIAKDEAGSPHPLGWG